MVLDNKVCNHDYIEVGRSGVDEDDNTYFLEDTQYWDYVTYHCEHCEKEVSYWQLPVEPEAS